MEAKEIAIIIVAILVIAAIASFVYFTYFQKAFSGESKKGPSSGELNAPVPFKPFGKVHTYPISSEIGLKLSSI